MRRAAISLIITFLPAFGIQTPVMAVVLIASLAVQKYTMPFTSRLVNNLELVSTAVVLYTYVVGNELARSSLQGFEVLKETMQTILWVVNALFVAILVFFLVQSSVRRTLQRILAARCCRKRVASGEESNT